jgi:hypothetical protein
MQKQFEHRVTYYIRDKQFKHRFGKPVTDEQKLLSVALGNAHFSVAIT